MKKTRNTIRWISGFLMILCAAEMFEDSIPQAVAALLFGVSLLPLTWKIIGKNLRFGEKLLPVFAPVILLIVYVAVSPSQPAQPTLLSVHTVDSAETDTRVDSQNGDGTEPKTNSAGTESQHEINAAGEKLQPETVTKPESAIQPESSHDLTLDVIDVGQGLALLLESDGHYLLYDGGGRDYSSKTVAFLKQHGVERLDYIIASHYDDDHLNGIVGALNVFDTDMVLAPDYIADTEIFGAFQRTLSEKGLSAIHPAARQQYPLGNSNFTVLAPVQTDYTDENDYSIVIRVACGSTSVLIPGDASSVSEAEIIADGQTADSDILIVGHHGSASSTSQAFLDYVSPDAAVVSCKLDNPYQHPSQEVMQRLETAHIPVFRTDMQGDIWLSTDGTSWNYSSDPCNDYSYNTGLSPSAEDAGQISDFNTYDNPEQQQTSAKYVLNNNTMKFHYPECRSVKKIAPHNYGTSSESRDTLIARGYSPCGNCHP